MKLRSWIRLFVACMVLASSATALPANAAARKRIHRAAAPAPKKLSNTEILVGQLAINSVSPSENLAQTCRRISFRNLAIALNLNRQLLNEEKGEFETSGQFAERQAKLADAINFRETVFCQPLNDNEDLPFTYEADAQRFEGSVSDRQNVWRDIKQLGSYRSKTAMGAAATVRASLEAEYNVRLDVANSGSDSACGSRSYSSFLFQVPYALESAAALKAKGYLVFVGKLVPPYVDYDEQGGSPTLDDPYDVHKVSITLHFRPSRFILVDGAGSEVWSCSPGMAPQFSTATQEQMSDQVTLPTGARPSPGEAAGDLSGALRKLSINGQDGDALLKAGWASLELDNSDAAIGFFARAEAVPSAAAEATAGLGAVLVDRKRPVEAIQYFDDAQAAGAKLGVHAGQRGLAYDLVGDNRRAQEYYREALAVKSSDEVTRWLALSQAIGGDQAASDATLLPLLQHSDLASGRTRAFALAALGKTEEAVSIATALMPASMASRIAPYLRYMPKLTRAQQAAAGDIGHFPEADAIGKDDPRIADLTSTTHLLPTVLRSAASGTPQAISAQISATIHRLADGPDSPLGQGDDEFQQLFSSWKSLD